MDLPRRGRDSGTARTRRVARCSSSRVAGRRRGSVVRGGVGRDCGYRRRVPDACPCGSRLPYSDCCGRLHRGVAEATTPEQLMRSRYSAFVVGDPDYLLRTWHPLTRPPEVRLDPAVEWLSLQVLDATGDEVEFIARYRGPGGRGFQRERSRFRRSGGRWLYLDGTAS